MTTLAPRGLRFDDARHRRWLWSAFTIGLGLSASAGVAAPPPSTPSLAPAAGCADDEPCPVLVPPETPGVFREPGGAEVVCLHFAPDPLVAWPSAERPYLRAADDDCRTLGPKSYRCGALTCVVDPSPPPPRPTEQERVPLFLLGIDTEGVVAHAGDVAASLVAVELARDARLDVVSRRDVDSLLALEAERRALGCAEDQSCVAQLADALGADFVASGTLGQAGRALVLQLTLFDVGAARVAARSRIEARDLFDLTARIPAGLRNLTAPILGHRVEALEPVWLGRQVEDQDAC